MHRRSRLALGVATVATLALAARARAQDAPEATPIDTTPAPKWPRAFEDPGLRLDLYQPQPEKWDGLRLVARAALAVQPAGASEPTFGVVWISAHTHVDKEQRRVSCEGFEVQRATFPTAPDQAAAWGQALARHLPESKVLDLDRLQASLAAAGTRGTARSAALGEDAPRIFFSTTPALLVLVDGDPVAKGLPSGTLRIVNTRSLLLQDRNGYCLGVGQRWLAAPTLDGPWGLAPSGPAGGDDARAALQQASLVDLHEEDAELAKLLDAGGTPRVIVSTRPAELVETNGEPELLAVEGTNLLWAKNTDADLFVDTSTNAQYLLIGGRWFRALSREGPWSLVPAAGLPADFARIPDSDPAGEVLASVPGTPEAQEALIANDIPQTAVVQRSEAHLDVVYDGDPRFEPVQGTSFGYALNTTTPVIQFGFQYYACEDGVWFTSTSPAGPWSVAAIVPAAIYSIPPTCPIYYVTFVRVYEAHPDWICFGYTPGYLGCCVRGGCVVWGTGYTHRAWCGHRWIGRPATYGFAAGLRWGSGVGFSVGLACGSRPACRPWWGPLGRPHSAFYPARVQGAEFHLNMANANVYAAWPDRIVRAHHGIEAAVHFEARAHSGHANDVFAAPDGRVYRHTSRGGWERHDGNRWQTVPAHEAELEHSRRLESERLARERGATRVENVHRQAPAPAPHYEPMRPQHPAPAPRPIEHHPAPQPIPPGLRGGPVRHASPPAPHHGH